MKRVGKVTNFFQNIGVVAVKLSDELKLGDEIVIKSEEKKRIEQEVNSLEEDGNPVEKGSEGSELGLKLNEGKLESQPHEGDEIYKKE